MCEMEEIESRNDSILPFGGGGTIPHVMASIRVNRGGRHTSDTPSDTLDAPVAASEGR